ncbi:MAG: hypothetical protein O3B76_09485 [Proteobacteria bacterium]|nr:hypothetical protein [Pseudomonadota bacterium]MDA1022783.1 hypothetical protein [Pseudomonadota bacterium]
MEFLAPLLQRKIIIALAIIGAVIATAGNFLAKKESRVDPKVARLILKTGYAITWASIALFIAAGFFGK